MLVVVGVVGVAVVFEASLWSTTTDAGAVDDGGGDGVDGAAMVVVAVAEVAAEARVVEVA